VKHVCTWIKQIILAKKMHKLNIFHVNGMWLCRTIDEDDDDDENGEEPPQADDHVQQPVSQEPIPHHGQMFGFQELQEGLNSLRIHINKRLDNLNMYMDTRLDHLQTHIDAIFDHSKTHMDTTLNHF